MDEHRLGLKPILKRVWARKGKRPTALVKHRYQWVYLYAFVCPQSGKSFWLVLPTVSVGAMTTALAQFAAAVGASKERRILLVLDRAGWHMSREVELPEGIELEPLPSHSPELQPAERLWELVDEVIANQVLADLEDLENRLVKRTRWLMRQWRLIRSRALFHWWPRLTSCKQ
jgi:transposase